MPCYASTGMIETAIPHSEFDDPDCYGCLAPVGRAGFIVDFVCNECGAVVACAREQVRIPLKAISHSGRKPITVPGGNRSGVGAKRRWHFDVDKN